ncbi:MAG: hypothetical protein DI539_03930 [Flavobacterium psychrophilum]|nr:MAG: hypothetical protein DI539_03930 [Flavobacterium psychrophilum]
MICLGCKKENHPKIEIYLLKNRQICVDCLPYIESGEYYNAEVDVAGLLKRAGYDTILKQVVYAGEFKVKASDLEKTPLISDEEITYLNLKSKEDKIVISPLAAKRIYKMYPENSYGNQFAITIDGKPVFTGYFWSYMSRYWCDWYQICVPHPDDNIRNDGKNKELSIYLGIRDGRRHDIKLDSLSYPEELIKAFRFSNRLIE